MNRESLVAITKNAWSTQYFSLGSPQAASNKLSRIKQVLLARRGSPLGPGDQLEIIHLTRTPGEPWIYQVSMPLMSVFILFPQVV